MQSDTSLRVDRLQCYQKIRKNRGDEPFQTGNRMQPAGAPPLCTTSFVSADQGNCRPQFLRSTVYSFPVTKDMCNSSRLPICMALQPYAQVDSMEVRCFIVIIFSLIFKKENISLHIQVFYLKLTNCTENRENVEKFQNSQQKFEILKITSI